MKTWKRENDNIKNGKNALYRRPMLLTVLSLIPCALDAFVKQRKFANWHV